MNTIIKRIAYIGMSKADKKAYEWGLENPFKTPVDSEKTLKLLARSKISLFISILSLIIWILLNLLLQ